MFTLHTVNKSCTINASTLLQFLPREAYSWARYCQGKLSVRPFVRLTVTLRYRDHIGWNSAKIVSRLTANHFSLCRRQHDGSTPKGTPSNFSWNRSGVGKIVDFRHLSRRISESVQEVPLPSCYWPLIGICIHVYALSIGTKIDDLRPTYSCAGALTYLLTYTVGSGV